MKKLVFASLILLTAFLPSCSGGGSGSAAESENISREEKTETVLECPTALEDRFSYAYGSIFASSLRSTYGDVDPGYFMQGFIDAVEDKGWFTEKELEDIFMEYQAKMILEEAEEFESEKISNLEEAEKFLALNSRRTGVHSMNSGLQYEKIKDSGVGAECRADSTVVIDYTLTTLDGTVVENSIDRGSRTVVKVSDLPKGFSEALDLMSEGDKWRFWIPPELAFGENGSSNIGPNELIIFEVTLFEVE